MAMWHTTIPEAAVTFSFLFRKPACHAMANMNDRTALATEYGYSGITPGRKAEQLTRSANVENEAVKLIPMSRVSICVVHEYTPGQDDNRCNFVDACTPPRIIFKDT